MKIAVTRSGGVAMPMPSELELDTETLPPDVAERLKQNIAAASFFELEDSVSGEGPGGDARSYTIAIEDDGIEHTVNTDELSAPDSLRPLLQQIDELIRGRRGE